MCAIRHYHYGLLGLGLGLGLLGLGLGLGAFLHYHYGLCFSGHAHERSGGTFLLALQMALGMCERCDVCVSIQ